jgi:benzoyl-CoA reductase/2-hydroxyglutaryl-CoA dehydratase subunit BcrC/BadD/HgdB
MISHCLACAESAKSQGKPIVGIMCEYTPRELIMAAGAVPVCLCGGSQDTIAAAERDLPANLCPLIKSTYGYHILERNPFLQMADLIVAETTCDGKKKMFELMGKTRPMYVLQLPHKENSRQAEIYWTEQLILFKEHLESVFKTQITAGDLREAIRRMNRERQLRRSLAELMKRDVPPFTGCELLDMKSIISGMDSALEQLQHAVDHFSSVPAPEENADRVRVLLTGVPTVHGAERIIELIENCGGIVVCQENCTGLKPIAEDVDENAPDPMKAIASKYVHLPCSIMTPNQGRLDRIEELARDYNTDCIIDLVWQACLTYDVESTRIRELSQKNLNLPYLRIETDYSPSDTARIRVRIEALLESASGRKTLV